MTRIKEHQTVAELELCYEHSKDTVEKSHFHAIWLIAKGHAIDEVGELLSFTPRWLRKLIERYWSSPGSVDSYGLTDSSRSRVLLS